MNKREIRSVISDDLSVNHSKMKANIFLKIKEASILQVDNNL